MTNFQKLVDGLGAKRQGGSWKACCPCHDDKNGSLDIAEKDGKVLVKCFAGCDQKAVISSLRAKGLWPEAKGNGNLPPGIYPKLKGAHVYSAHWEYRGQDGRTLGFVARYDHPTERKQFLPFFQNDGGKWLNRAAPKPRPLYGLWRLEKKPEAPIIITEGEKSCDAAQRLFPGHVCLASPGGADSAKAADWKPLAGRSVTVWPDNDEPGFKYTEDVISCLRAVGADVRGVIDVEVLEMPEKGDAADWPIGKALPEPLPIREAKEANPKKGSNSEKKEAGGSKTPNWEARGSSEEANGKQQGSNWEARNEDEEDRAVRGLTGPIRNWIMESRGCFTTQDIDREFCLHTRTEKNRRSRVLHELLYKEKKILKDFNGARGVWHVVEDSPEWVDLDAEETASFPVVLPLNLNAMVNIPPKSIIIIGGVTNAGKTAFMLEIAALNIRSNKDRMVYMFSEMGHGEFKKRLRDRVDVPYEHWKGMRSLEGLRDYGGIVHRHNPDGISFVDYLEEVDGEYSKLASQIRRIYDCLGDGVCIIGLQKNSNNTYAKGGEGTAEKARLYLTMDKILDLDSGSIAAIKIVKAKDYSGPNPNGKEIHVKVNGKGISPLMREWARMDQKSRESMVEQYRKAFG